MKATDSDGKTGTLRAVSAAKPQVPPIGAKLRALRDRLGWSHSEIVRRAADAAATLGPGYSAITRELYSKIENDHETARLTTYKQRAVLARTFGVNTDQFSAYLDERLPLENLLAIREAGASPAPLAAGRAERRYGDHPRWQELIVEARDEDPELSDETFAEMAEEQFFSAGFDIVTAHVVAVNARILQNYRARTRRPRG